MKKTITFCIFIISTMYCFGQKIEPNFIDNFKTSKWKSVENFNDSTILELKELQLVRWNPERDTLTDNPLLWIFNDEFKIKYYYNVSKSENSSSRSFNTIDCKYSYVNDKGILTIQLDNKVESILSYKCSIVSTGSFILLTRTKKK